MTNRYNESAGFAYSFFENRRNINSKKAIHITHACIYHHGDSEVGTKGRKEASPSRRNAGYNSAKGLPLAMPPGQILNAVMKPAGDHDVPM